MKVRTGEPSEVPEVMGILDAAMLDISPETVRSVTDSGVDGAVLLAAEEGRILGALVLVGREIEAVAVRPKRRGQGIGTALVGVASGRGGGRLVAAFDAGLRPFYEGLGFEVAPAGEAASAGGEDSGDGDRLQGRLGDDPP